MEKLKDTDEKLYNPHNFNKQELINIENSIKNIEWYFTDTRDWLQNAFKSSSLESTYKIITLISHYVKALNWILEWWYAWATEMEQEKFNFIKNNGIRLSAFWSSKVKTRDIEKHFKPILDAESKIATIFVKCSPSQIKALKITKEENLWLIKDSIKYLKDNNIEVIIDLEHFFDWYYEDKEYSKKCIKTIIDSWWEKVVLCDTLWKTSPDNIKLIINELCKNDESPNLYEELKWKIWLHLHEDSYNTTESVIKAISTWFVWHVQWNFWYSWERVWNTPLALVFAKLLENYNIDVFDSIENKDKLWRNLLSTYSQISYQNNWIFPWKVDSILNPENYYHWAWLHVLLLERDPKTYSPVSEKLLNKLNISNYPWLTKQWWKYNVSYYLKKAFDLSNTDEKIIWDIICKLMNHIKKSNSLDYTDSIASFLLQWYIMLNYINEENIQKIINEEFWISKITTAMETDNSWEHLNTMVTIQTQEKTFVRSHTTKSKIMDVEKENWIFNWVFNLLKWRLKDKYDYIDNLKLVSYETKSQNQDSDANVIVKLVFKDKTSNMIFWITTQNKNADIANIFAIKEAFYYFILCKEWKIKHYQNKLLEVRYWNIEW